MNGHATDLIDAYALGELDAESRALVRTHLAECGLCRAEYDDARAVFDLLPLALEPVKPHDRVLQNILERTAPTAAASRRARLPAGAGIAAVLALALAGDIVLGALLATRHDRTIAVRATTPRPLPTTATQQPPNRAHGPVSPPVALQQPVPKPKRTVAAAEPSAAPSAPSSRPRTLGSPQAPPQRSSHAQDVRLRDVARLVRERNEAIEALRIRSTQDAGRIAQLEHRLTTKSGAGAREAVLLSALENGGVYAIRGTVDGEPWHCTVLQPTPTANAVLLTSAPSAPPGEEYRVWVIRNKRTYDAGAIAPRASVALEMPMPLVAGDVVAFSREPESTGKLPTQPFLMELPISN